MKEREKENPRVRFTRCIEPSSHADGTKIPFDEYRFKFTLYSCLAPVPYLVSTTKFYARRFHFCTYSNIVIRYSTKTKNLYLKMSHHRIARFNRCSAINFWNFEELFKKFLKDRKHSNFLVLRICHVKINMLHSGEKLR